MIQKCWGTRAIYNIPQYAWFSEKVIIPKLKPYIYDIKYDRNVLKSSEMLTRDLIADARLYYNIIVMKVPPYTYCFLQNVN